MSDRHVPQPADALAQIAEAGAAGKGPNAFVFAFYQLFRTAQIHAIDNQALSRPIQQMFELSSAIFMRDGRVSLLSREKTLFLNGVKLKLSTEEYELAQRIMEFLKERDLSGFDIDGPLTPDAIRKVLAILVYATPADRDFGVIDAALKAAELPFRVIKRYVSQNAAVEEIQEKRAHLFFTYAKLVVLFRTVVEDEKMTGARRALFVRKIARTIQSLVDICMEDEQTFLAASIVKRGADYPAHHAANATIMALALGRKLGMGKSDLADLGISTVFHDVGLRTCPAELLEKDGSLDVRERAVIDQHPIRSVEFLLEEKRFTKSALSRIIVAFEHHRTASGTGFPPSSRRPDVFSRIVKIADVYDALTSKRPWRGAYLPDAALGIMLRDNGKEFDNALLKEFVHMVGIYRVGTLVRMDTGEVGLVISSGGEGSRLSRPIVMLLDNDGQPAGTADLLETSAMGVYRRTVVATEEPSRYGLQPSGFLARSGAMIEAARMPQ